jgi:hypothetical protein
MEMKVNTKLLRFAVARLAERSTWAGLGGLLVLAGLSVSGAQIDAIVSAASAVFSLVLVFWPEPKSAE